MFNSTTHNGNFYFNTRSLDTNEITTQSINVMMSYEMMVLRYSVLLVTVEEETKTFLER